MPETDWKANPSYSQNVVIANGQQASAEADLGGRTLVAIALPAALTGTAMTFQASSTTGGTFKDVTNADGTSYSITVAASKFAPVDPQKFLGVRFLKVKSGSAEGAARTVELILRKL